MNNKKFPIIAMIFLLLTGCSNLKNQSKQKYSSENNFINGEKSMVKKVEKTDEEWKKILTPEQYYVMRKRGTERAFSGKYNDHYEEGVYHCPGCGTPLFSSETKYDYGTGWPSFTEPIDEKHVQYLDDHSLFMTRTEVRCAVCGAHLGHVFDDGPLPTYKHYCINSVALNFKAAEQKARIKLKPSEKSYKTESKATKTETATFAAGCFWGVEHKFRQVEAVLSTVAGYTGGHVENPTYKQVCSDTTGHAEAVKITYDPSKVSYSQLLEVFLSIHDPTQLNRQGPDIGRQYKSAIFYHSEEQKQIAKKMVENLEKSAQFRKPIVTEILPASEFYKAEEYHQQYIEKLNRCSKGGCGTSSCGK